MCDAANSPQTPHVKPQTQIVYIQINNILKYVLVLQH